MGGGFKIGHDKRDIARRAVQSALAAALAYLAVQATGTGEAFLAVISAVLVLENDRDQTLESAGSRIAATMIGTGVGIAALALANDATTVFSLALVMLIMGGIAAWKPDWRYGIVAAAGLAVGSEQSFWVTAQNRCIAIFLGAGIGLAVGSLVWSESARRRARRQLADAIGLCRKLLEATISAALQRGESDRSDLHGRFSKAIEAAGDTASSIHFGADKADKPYCDATHRVERLWHALIILDRVSETRDEQPLQVRDDLLDEVKEVQQAACRALGSLERLERLSEDDMRALERCCARICERADLKGGTEDSIETVALVYGLREVSRNMREIDAAICAMGASG